MCLIAYKPKDILPDFESYATGFAHNNDGAGFVACTQNGLVIKKGYWNFDQFVNDFEKYADCVALVHFRIATHGDKDAKNCHPFDVGGIHGNRDRAEKVAVVHNGVLTIPTPEASMSDTWHFTKNILYPMFKKDEKFFTRPECQERIDKFLVWDKMAFLDHEGNCVILNQDRGNWKGGHWYSNYSHNEYSYRASSVGGRTVTDEFEGMMASASCRASNNNLPIIADSASMEDWTYDEDGCLVPFTPDRSMEISQDRYSELVDSLQMCGAPWDIIQSVYKNKGLSGLEDLASEYFSAGVRL